MRNGTFETPEAAALEGFPSTHCHVVASLESGDDAYVLLDTGSDGHPYLYGGCVARRDGGWVGGTDGNGPGWSLTDPERELGTATAWGEAPAGADRVRVTCGGTAWEAAIENGVYLLAWWRVPATADPRVEAFRIGGEWVPAARVPLP